MFFGLTYTVQDNLHNDITFTRYLYNLLSALLLSNQKKQMVGIHTQALNLTTHKRICLWTTNSIDEDCNNLNLYKPNT